MAENLERLIERARQFQMTPEAQEAQRRSFAFGTAAIENARVTRETVRTAAEHILAGRTQVVEVGPKPMPAP